MNFVLKLMDFVSKMMDFVFKMMILIQISRKAGLSDYFECEMGGRTLTVGMTRRILRIDPWVYLSMPHSNVTTCAKPRVMATPTSSFRRK